MATIICQQQLISSGNKTYPIFIGFLPAVELLAIAEAPAFGDHTPNHQIASNVLNPPIQEWQRPLDMQRVDAISDVYSDVGELMPNPVLLCQNVSLPLQLPPATSVPSATGHATGLWTINIPDPLPGQPRPLWILDGQHRINGLARSLQKLNPVPVVLLLNQGAAAYTGPALAKIFAQVTTAAQKLDELHNEWLTFAFKLDRYNPSEPHASEAHQSMETVAELCRSPTLGPQQAANPFFNQVQFNAAQDIAPVSGGFEYSCIELKDLVREHYYSAAAAAGHLPPRELATQLASAYESLSQVVQPPLANTVFFGDNAHSQRIMQDAYIVGVLSYLKSHGAPPSWGPVLSALHFGQTNWDFSSWVVTLNGAAASVSRRLALQAMAHAFSSNGLPTGSSNLVDFIQGNNAQMELVFSKLTPGGSPAAADKLSLVVKPGTRQSPTVSPRLHLKVASKTHNVGDVEFTDLGTPPGVTVNYPEASRGGLRLDPTRHSRPLRLLVTMHHFGGLQSQAHVNIGW